MMPAALSEGMSLADLEHLRLRLSGCEIAMLADIAATTVLGVSSALAHPQEHYDQLCTQARTALTYGGRPRPYAVLAGPLGVRLHLRAPDHPDEVLSLVLPRLADVDLALQLAEAALTGRTLAGEASNGS
ncbi:hypothetical protein [Vannielia litorea]|uniref:hypothetical protein n=1 Tax=Vannielia litorea TaxID=1217970 RepID=UPI001C9453E2|nr:hypothetical protein [Vannielia litorea]MBY6047849.1 hypothetical protein [Vannielia litorea]MBY6075263.1 hypothetical protein [Vannielia litorea]